MQNRPRGAYLAPRFVLRGLSVFVGFLLFLSARDAHAYPWMIKHGYTNCSGCHADPSGGELLTLYGHAISYEALSTRWGGKSESAATDARRVAEAVARAARAKSAPKKRIAAEEVNLDEAPAKSAPAATGNAATESDEGDDAPKKKPEPKKKPGSEEEEEEGAEEEAGEDESSAAPGAEASTEASGASSDAAEPSPFEGMSKLTGPLFGLMKPRDKLLLGGSFRMATAFSDGSLRAFPMQIDLYGQLRLGDHFRAGGSVGVAKVPAGSPHARAAQVTTNQGDGYNMISRTHWVGFDFGDGAHTVRAGRLNLPFGIRMSEHTMWIREKTQTDRESDQQHGVALAMGFDKVRFEVMGILGNYQINDRFRERGYSGYVEFVVAEKAAVGVSSLYTEAKSDRVFPEGLRTARSAHGVFVRASPGTAVAILAEADVLTRSRREMGYVSYLQADIEPLSGLHLLATGEVMDLGWAGGSDRSAPRIKGQGKPDLGGWLGFQWFFLPHFDFRVDAIFRSETEVLGQLHVYL
jgi:hypothetical protein